MSHPPRLVLASQSPRRIRMLSDLHIPFRILHVKFRETMPSLPPEEAARLLAWRKVETACRHLPEGIVIAADTIVAKHGHLYGKPKNERDAESMLRQLAGGTHEVITAVAVMNAKTKSGMLASETSRVTFRNLNAKTIKNYVATGEPLDKAGGYAIQGLGGKLISRFTGDRLNIIGLPVKLLAAMLRKFGIRIPNRRIASLYATGKRAARD